MRALGQIVNRRLWVGFAGAMFLVVAGAAALAADGAPEPEPESVRGPDLWFPVGEQLVYKIYWGVLPVGRTEITSEWVEEDGRVLLAIRYRTRSNKVVATIYPVDDLIESIIDPDGFRAVRFTKNLKEGRHRYHEETRFDYAAGEAKWKSFIKDKSKTYAINPDTRDLVSFMYFMRSQDFIEGRETRYEVMADEKLYELLLKVEKKEQNKLDGFGKVETWRIEPKARFDGLFVRKGRMTVWVSTDKRRLCTRVKARVPVASIHVKLTRVLGPGDDFWIERSPKDEDAVEE